MVKYLCLTECILCEDFLFRQCLCVDGCPQTGSGNPGRGRVELMRMSVLHNLPTISTNTNNTPRFLILRILTGINLLFGILTVILKQNFN